MGQKEFENTFVLSVGSTLNNGYAYRELSNNSFNPHAVPTWLGNLTNLEYLCVVGVMTSVVVLGRRAHAGILAGSYGRVILLALFQTLSAS